MSIHEAFDLLSAYLDGELSDREKTMVDAHLATCADCALARDALRLTVGDLRALEDPVPSEQDSWALGAALARARRRGEQPRYARFAMAASGAAAVLIGVVFAVSQNGAPDRQAALAPEAAALGVDAATVLVTNENFTERSAHSFLLGFPVAAGGSRQYGAAVADSAASEIAGGAGQSADGDQGKGTVIPELAAPQSAPAARAAGPDPSAFTQKIAACQRREILPNTDERLEPVSYRVARYKKQPAFLIVYRVPDAKPVRLELWVLHQETCRTLYFAQKTSR
jgi:hypothetical protein